VREDVAKPFFGDDLGQEEDLPMSEKWFHMAGYPHGFAESAVLAKATGLLSRRALRAAPDGLLFSGEIDRYFSLQSEKSRSQFHLWYMAQCGSRGLENRYGTVQSKRE
jgi:hypothetical protein